MPIIETQVQLPAALSVDTSAVILPITRAAPLQSTDPLMKACNACGLLFETKSMLKTKDGYFVCRLCLPSVSRCRNCGQKIAVKDLVAAGPAEHCPECGTLGKPALKIPQEQEFVPRRNLLEIREATVWEAA